MKQLAPFIIFIFTFSNLLGQIPTHIFNEISEETYNSNDFTSKEINIKNRLGIYHFGESEAEWDFVLLQNNDSLIIQIWSGDWGKNYLTKKETWLLKCKTFNEVILNGNKIMFDKFTGLFTEYKHNNKTTKTLLLFSDPFENRNYNNDSAEVGHFNYYSTVDNYYKLMGCDKDYYKLSTQVLQKEYFKSKSKQELKIMRNTIYARYGLIFQPGGEMEKYFRTKKWYNPYQNNVSNCISEIEKKNIKLINEIEKQ